MAYFKYMKLERFDGLRAGRVRFTQPGAFNDPFEMPAFKIEEIERGGVEGLMTQTSGIMDGLLQGYIPRAAFELPIDYFLGNVSQKAESEEERAIKLESAKERLRDIDKVFGILSLSMTADNLLLWAHYADEHRGIAVEIDIEDKTFKRSSSYDDEFQRAAAVRYSAKRPSIPVTDAILYEHFFAKSPEWSYEKEFRIVRKLASCIKTALPKDPERRYPMHLFELPPSAIRRIIFGARIRPDQRPILLEKWCSDPRFAHVEFAKAVLDRNRFGIEIRGLEDPIDTVPDGTNQAWQGATAQVQP